MQCNTELLEPKAEAISFCRTHVTTKIFISSSLRSEYSLLCVRYLLKLFRLYFSGE